MTTNKFPQLAPAADFQSANGTYKPGGDAQHVSALIRALIAEALEKAVEGTTITRAVKINYEMKLAAFELLPSAALRHKLDWAITNVEKGRSRVLTRVAKELGFKFPRATRKNTPEYVETTVKIGRWEYPAREHTDGTITRNTKRDGTGEWVKN